MHLKIFRSFIFLGINFSKRSCGQLIYSCPVENLVRPLGVLAHHAEFEFLLLVLELFLGLQQNFRDLGKGLLDS